LGRVNAAFDIGDLGCSEGYYLILLVISEEYIKVVEVSTRGSHDKQAHIPHAGLSFSNRRMS
jgi:hypothetical protein